MPAPNRLQLYLDMYYFELERKDSVNSNLQVSFGVITLLGGAAFFIITNMPTPDYASLWYWIFLAVFMVALQFLVTAGVYLARAWWGHEYGFLARPTSIERWHASLVAYNAQHPEHAVDLDERFEGYLIREAAEVTSRGRASNAAKMRLAHEAGRRLLTCICLLALSFLPFYLVARDELGIAKIQVVDTGAEPTLEAE